MITLTTVPQVQSVLGGNVPVGYDKLVVSNISYDPIAHTINAALRLTSTGNTQMEALPGSLVIRKDSSEVTMGFTTGVQFTRRLLLSSPQVAAVQGLLDDAQADIENGLISLGVVAGVRSAGV